MPTPQSAGAQTPTAARPCALITGASAGLGEALARRFARDGFELVLVARDRARLERLAREVQEAHGAKAHVLPADLVDPLAPRRLFDEVTALGLAVEVLVNNAGFGSNGLFVDLPLETEAAMVEVNCTALLKLAHLFGAPMAARGRGRILNMASTAAFQAGPSMATYYATKAFVLSFSEALADELAPRGVTVTCFCPGATATEFAQRAGTTGSKLFQRVGVASAVEVADAAFEATMAGEVLAVHGVVNWLGAQAQRLAPRSWTRAIAGFLNRP